MPSGSHIFAIAFYRDREEKPTTYFLSGDLERHHLFQSDLYFSKFQNIFVPISELSKSFPTCSAILLHGDDDDGERSQQPVPQPGTPPVPTRPQPMGAESDRPIRGRGFRAKLLLHLIITWCLISSALESNTFWCDWGSLCNSVFEPTLKVISLLSILVRYFGSHDLFLFVQSYVLSWAFQH